MKNTIKTALLSCALLGSHQPAQALDLGYDYQRLDIVWQAIGNPDTRIFEDILGKYELNRNVAIDPQKGSVTGSQCRPPRQCVSGQKPATGGATTPDSNAAVEFDVVRINRPEHIQTIYKRYGLMSLYIAKNAQFNGVTLTEDEKKTMERADATGLATSRMNAVRQQMASAVVESYLLHLSQYYLAEDLGAKCQAMQAADKLFATSLKNIQPATDLLPAYLTLYQQYINLIHGVQRNQDRFLACTVIPTSTRAETVNAIQNTVAEEVNKALATKVAATITLLDGSDSVLDCPDPVSEGFKNLSEFQKLACLRRGLDAIVINLKDTFELARNVKNLRANLDFIKESEPALRSRQNSLLQEAGLNQLYQPIPGVTPFPKLSNAKEVVKETSALLQVNKTVKDQIQNALNNMVALSDKVSPSGVAGCKDAQDLFPAALTGLENSATQMFINRTEACLGNLNAALQARIVPTLEDRMQEKFTLDVSSLAAAVQISFEQNAIQIIDNLAN